MAVSAVSTASIDRISVDGDKTPDATLEEEKNPLDNGVRYCCCLTESQIKQAGIAIGSILLIVGVAGLVFGVLISAWFLVAAYGLAVIGGVGLIYLAVQMEGLGQEVDELIAEVKKTKEVVDHLSAVAIKETRNNVRLGKEIERLKQARKLIVEDLQKALDEIKNVQKMLEKTVRETNAKIEEGVRERLEALDAGVDAELQDLKEGSEAYLALAATLADKQAEIDDLRGQLAGKDTEIARLQKLLPKGKK